MSTLAYLLTIALSALASVAVFIFGGLFLLTYVLITAIVAALRWLRAVWRRMMHQRADAAVSAPSR
jgi:phage-related holin